MSKLTRVSLHKVSLDTSWACTIHRVFTVPCCQMFMFWYIQKYFVHMHVPGSSTRYILYTYCNVHPGTCAETPTHDCPKCIKIELLIIKYARSQKREIQCTARFLICTVRCVAWGRLERAPSITRPLLGVCVKWCSRASTRDTWHNHYGLGKQGQRFTTHWWTFQILDAPQMYR